MLNSCQSPVLADLWIQNVRPIHVVCTLQTLACNTYKTIFCDAINRCVQALGSVLSPLGVGLWSAGSSVAAALAPAWQFISMLVSYAECDRIQTESQMRLHRYTLSLGS